MSGFDPALMPWRLPAPDDLRATLRAWGSQECIAGPVLRQLATHALDLNHCTSLARVVTRSFDKIDADGAFDPVRLAVLGSGTSDLVLPAVLAGGLRHGVLAQIYATPFGQALAEALNDQSALAAHRTDIALIAFDHHGYGLTTPSVDPSAGARAVEAAVSQLTLLASRMAAAGAQVLIQTVPHPVETWAGQADASLPGSVRAQIVAMNDRIRALCAAQNYIVCDIEALAAQVGTGRWFNARLWHQAKAPFDLDIAPLYGDHIGRLLGALRGKSRKALVLDLDNTLWGGIIGDDGLDGIKIGQGSIEGEAHLAVQRLALDLKARGIILCVCSKNEDTTARGPFRELEDMLIREEDIAVFVANWTDKGTNIANIAKTLNIGVDALVFLDDHPAERARVRQVLPQVAVPELPEDPSLYAATLASAGYFETVGVSEDDAKRAEQYRANAQRVQAMEAVGDMEAYYQSLEMVCSIRPFDAQGRTRTAQLINKTNQFNLTTQRYTPAEVEAMEQDPGVITRQVRLTDRFGDNGMISVVIFRARSGEWICDTWLMSCRVLGRRVEEAVLNTLVADAKKAGVPRLVGIYRPSPRNAMVAGFWEKLGFVQADQPDGLTAEQGETAWAMKVAGYVTVEVPMQVELG